MARPEQEQPNRAGRWVARGILVLLIAAAGLLAREWYRSAQRRPAMMIVEVPAAGPGGPGSSAIARVGASSPAPRMARPRQASPMPDATPITLKLDGASPQQAFAALSQAIGTEIGPPSDAMWQRSADKRVSIQAVGKPFWDVMMDLCQQTEMSPSANSGNGRRIELAAASRGNILLPACRNGPFMLTAERVVRTIRADLADDGSGSETVDVQMMLYAEPKIGIVHVSSPAVLEAIDDRGNLLSAGSGQSTSPSRAWSVPVTLRLTCAAILGRQILRVRGQIPVGVTGRLEPAEFTDLLGAQHRPAMAGGIFWTLLEVRATPTACTIVLGVDGLTMSDLYRLAPHLSRTARLLDAKGQAWPLNSSTPAARPEIGDAPTFRMMFRRPRGAPDPRRLLLQVPAQIDEVLVPFEFKDLPVP